MQHAYGVSDVENRAVRQAYSGMTDAFSNCYASHRVELDALGWLGH